MSIKLKTFLELYVPKGGDERKFVAKHIIKKTADANKNDDKLFKATNVKTYNRKLEHGYNTGDDEKVYEETEHLTEMDVRTAKELASKYRHEGKLKHASIYEKVASALQRGDQTTAQGFMSELKNIDEATLTPGEMKKREDFVKGMKKNLASFKQRYGEQAKSVMYATATKMAKEEVEQIDEWGSEWQTKDVKKAHQVAKEKSAEHGKTLHIAKMKNGYSVSGVKGSGDSHIASYNKGSINEEVDLSEMTLLNLYMSLDEENQQEMIKMIDEGMKPELVEFAQSIME